MPTDFDDDLTAQPGGGDVKGTNTAEYSVSDLAGAIKRAIEDGFGYVRLRGKYQAIVVLTPPGTAISR